MQREGFANLVLQDFETRALFREPALQRSRMQCKQRGNTGFVTTRRAKRLPQQLANAIRSAALGRTEIPEKIVFGNLAQRGVCAVNICGERFARDMQRCAGRLVQQPRPEEAFIYRMADNGFVRNLYGAQIVLVPGEQPHEIVSVGQTEIAVLTHGDGAGQADVD